MENTFYISVSAHFKNDYDVAKLEKILGVKASKLTFLKDSNGPTASAKFLYNTKEFTNAYPDKLFEQFVDSLYNNAKNIKNELLHNEGNLTFCIVFKNFVTKPCLYLSNKTLSQMSEMGAGFDVDM